MCKSIFNQLSSAPMPKNFCQTWAKFAKRACFAVQKVELYKSKLKKITAVKNAWKNWQRQANKLLKTRGILDTKDMQYMI